MPLRNLRREIKEMEKHDIVIIVVSLLVIFFCFYLIQSISMEDIYRFTAAQTFEGESASNPLFVNAKLHTKQTWSLAELFRTVGETAEKKAFLESVLIDLALLLMIFEVMLHVHKMEMEFLREEEELEEEEERLEEEVEEIAEREKRLEMKEKKLEEMEKRLEKKLEDDEARERKLEDEVHGKKKK
ncbi:MAG: hypothetical protein QF415_00580 [Candidatus Undinarchaeales archaeon]|jgi:hypothetical protein|nr:hypothetical protein [Candidatus Undinarchaeales archaeon]MDP7492098.1 hypothetical protein [Candidatus Undinarchaeales archaeon]